MGIEASTFSCSSRPISFSLFSVINTKFAPPVAGLTAQPAVASARQRRVRSASGRVIEFSAKSFAIDKLFELIGKADAGIRLDSRDQWNRNNERGQIRLA